MYAKLKVNGVNVTSSWLHEKSRVDSIITKRVDTAHLEIEDTIPLNIQEKHEVIISNNAETERYFAGYIASLAISLEGGIKKIFGCSCQDYTILLDSVIVNEIYED